MKEVDVSLSSLSQREGERGDFLSSSVGRQGGLPLLRRERIALHSYPDDRYRINEKTTNGHNLFWGVAILLKEFDSEVEKTANGCNSLKTVNRLKKI